MPRQDGHLTFRKRTLRIPQCLRSRKHAADALSDTEMTHVRFAFGSQVHEGSQGLLYTLATLYSNNPVTCPAVLLVISQISGAEYSLHY